MDLDTVEPLAPRVQRHAFDRLIMLSDGVFAIAITLAALELRPSGEWSTPAQLWAGLKLPLIAYAVSFAVIAAYWTAHRDTFARLSRVDMLLSVLTLVQLFFIALLPAATKLLYEGGTPGGVAAYAAAVTCCGFTQVATWAYAAFRPGLMSPEVPSAYRVARLLVTAVMPGFFAWLLFSGVRSVGPRAVYAAAAASVLVLLLRRFVLPRLHRLPG